MNIRSKKKKGKVLEKLVAKRIIEAYYLNPEDIRTPVGNEVGADIKLSTKAQRDFPYSVECKNQEKVAFLYEFYEQAKRHYPKLMPLLVVKSNYHEPLAVLDLDLFLTISYMAQQNNNKKDNKNVRFNRSKGDPTD